MGTEKQNTRRLIHRHFERMLANPSSRRDPTRNSSVRVIRESKFQQSPIKLQQQQRRWLEQALYF